MLKSKFKQLSKEEINLFLTDGCVVVHDVFPKEIANIVLSLISAELKLDMNDPLTWPKQLMTLQKVFQKKKVNDIPNDLFKFTPVVVLRKELETELLDKIYTERYIGIIDDLCGQGRWKTRKGIGHWPILFPLFKDQPGLPLEGSWHLDGDFEGLNLTSGDWGLILMYLFTDIHPGGGTAVRIGSHRYTAQILAEAGSNGLIREELIPCVIDATRHLPVKELTGNTGDLFIMHPWVIHSNSLNTSDQFRIAANKHITLQSPMNFNRNKKSDYSLVEFSVLNAIARNGKNLPSKNIEANKTNKEFSKPKQRSFLKILKGMNLLNYINAKDIVRILVLRSNRYWPFSKLNKIPYEFALKAIVNHCKKYPQINSVYLRRSLKNGNWTPALSDIDLTIISKKNLTPEREFEFLNSFWIKFGQLKKLYPMYGEIYIINEEDFELWKQLEFEGKNVQNWILLSGNEVRRNNISINKTHFQLDAFNLAFNFYLNHFLGLFNRKGISSRLISSDLLRVRNKILKCLNGYRNIPKSGTNGNKSVIQPKIELLINIITELKNGLSNNPSTPSQEVTKRWQNEVEEKNNLIIDYKAVDMKKLLQWHDDIQCIYLNFPKKIFIILKDGLDQQTFDNCIKAVARVFSNENPLPVILNVTLFKYFLCQYKPFEYGHFIYYRTLAFGTDILPDITLPYKSAIENQLIKGTAEILKFPFSRKFFSLFGKSDSVTEFIHVFNTALMTKYYLEHGIISPWYQEFLDSSYKAYPNHVKKFEEQKRSKMPYIELFMIYKQLAKEIHGSIITNTKLNLFASENHI